MFQPGYACSDQLIPQYFEDHENIHYVIRLYTYYISQSCTHLQLVITCMCT